jgi:positive regulator of sigma E activity
MLGNSIVRLWTFEILIVIYVLFLVGALLIELIEFSYYMDILISYVFLVLFYFDLKALIKKTVDRKISSRKVLRKLNKHDPKD